MLAGSLAFNKNPCITLMKFTEMMNALLRPGVTLETMYDNGVPVLFSGELSADSSSLTGTYIINGTGAQKAHREIKGKGNWVATRDLARPTMTALINSASSMSGAIAPGEIISIKSGNLVYGVEVIEMIRNATLTLIVLASWGSLIVLRLVSMFFTDESFFNFDG